MTFNVTVEIPQGSRNKYEVDHATGRIKLDRCLFTSTQYPSDYGYIDNTLGRDGDPLDALVILKESTFPSCLIKCRAIAMLKMTDESGSDDKVVCVPATDPRFSYLQDLEDIPQQDRDEILHFFEVYKTLEPGKSVANTLHWVGKAEADVEIREAFERLVASHNLGIGGGLH
ncbi:MAG: inorganic diphosphatase [Bifidobacteriaceae bacterium]|nr:inorganic diphosphatase [Bifidobacteriaceae bacterium]